MQGRCLLMILFVCLVVTACFVDPPWPTPPAPPEKVPYRIAVDGREYLCLGHDIVDFGIVVLYGRQSDDGPVTIEMEFEILGIRGE